MVKLKNNYEIDSDGRYGFTLLNNTGKIDKYGNEIKITYGYYTDFETALKGYCCQVLKNKISDNEMDLIDVKKALEELKQEIKVYEMKG